MKTGDVFRILICFLALSVTDVSRGQTSESQEEPQKTPEIPDRFPDGAKMFRRIFYPESRFKEVLPMMENLPYRPIRAETFQEWILAAVKQNVISDTSGVLSAIHLSARLEGNQLMDGKGNLKLTPQSPEQDNAGKPGGSETEQSGTAAMIPLEPFGISLTEPIWENGAGAKLGFLSRGVTGLQTVPDSDTLYFQWTLRGTKDIRENILFHVSLPSVPVLELILDIPRNMKPAFSAENDGFIRLIHTGDEPEDFQSSYRRWQIIPGAKHEFVLQILYDNGSITPQQQTGFSQTNQYNVSLRGLSLTSVFTFEKTSMPVSEVLMELDAPLKPLTLRCGDTPLEWTEIVSEEGNPDAPIRILAAVPVSDSNERELQLSAYCPVKTGMLWNLPRVRLHSERVFWNETRNNVYVFKPLSVQKLLHQDLREITAEAGGDSSGRELFVFQAYEESSLISMEFGQENSPFLYHCGTLITWGERDVLSTTVVDVSVTDGTLQQLEMLLDNQWTLEAVSSPTAQISDYFLMEMSGGPPEKTDKGSSQWIIPLNKAVTPQSPLRLILNTRCPLSALTQNQKNTAEKTDNNTAYQDVKRFTIDLNKLCPFVFLRGKQGTRLLSLDSSVQYRIGEKRLEQPDNVTQASIQERYEVIPSGLILPCDSLPLSPVSVETLSPAFQGTVLTQVILKKGSLEQICRFTCVPQNNSPLSQINVKFSPSAVTDSQWSWSDSFNSSDVSQIQAAAIPDGHGTIWQIRPSVPKNTSFEFYAKRTVPFVSQESIPLPYFAGQQDFTALVSLETPDSDMECRVKSEGLASSPPPQMSVNLPRMHGYYTYTDRENQTASLKIEPVLSDQQTVSLSCIWSMVFQTKHDSIGNTICHIAYSLENRGIDRLLLTLPRGVKTSDVHAVWIDGIRSSWHAEPKGEQTEISAQLPDKTRFSLIELEYTFQDKELHSAGSFLPMSPAVNIPVIAQSWIAWVSPAYLAYPKTQRTDTSFWNRFYTTAFADPFFTVSWSDLIFGNPREEEFRKIAQKISEMTDNNPQNTYPLNIPAVSWENTTWKEFLEMLRFPAVTILVDETSLSRIGIFASGTVPFEHGGIPAPEQNGLAWIFDDTDTLVLTSNLTKAKLTRRVRPIFGERFFHFKGNLRQLFTESGSLHRFIPLSQWERLSSPGNTPWKTPESSIRFEPAQWYAYEQYWEADTVPSLFVLSANRNRAFKQIAFLLIVVLTWPQKPAKPVVFFLLLLFTFFAARFLPLWWQDSLCGFFWGIICSILFSLLKISPVGVFKRKVRTTENPSPNDSSTAGEVLKRPFSSDSSGSTSGFSSASGSVLTGLLILFLPSLLVAEEDSSSVTAVPYKVFIPFDPETKKPADYYHIPDEFYRKLQQEFEESRVSQHHWQITKAEYQGTFINNTLFNLRVLLNIEIPEQSGQLRLPPMPLRPDGAKLDKQPVQSALDPKTQEHLFEIAGRGTHQLELLLTPKIEEDKSLRYFEIPIPPIVNSHIELTLNSEVSKVEISGAKGQVSVSSGILSAELGAVSRLNVSWPVETVAAGPADMNVTQLLWLNARSNQLELRAQWKFNTTYEKRSHLFLNIDPRFQLSGKYRCNGVSIEHEMIPQKNGLCKLLFKTEISGETVIQADYVLSDFSGIGHTRFPRFSVPDDRLYRNLLGISVTPSLEVLVPESTMQSRDFEEAWGISDETIQYAYDRTKPDTDGIIAIRQKPAKYTSSVIQQMTFKTQKIQTQVRMAVTSEGETHHYTLFVPKQFQPEKAVVRDSSEVIQEPPRMVFHEKDSTLTLFFKHPVTGNFSLFLTGEIPFPFGKMQPYPLFFAEQGEDSEHIILPYRDFGVLVEQKITPDASSPLNEPFRMNDFEISEQSVALGKFRLLSLDAFKKSAVTIQPNEPDITGNQILVLDRNLNNDAWEMIVILEMEISRGEPDQLVLSFPPEVMITDKPSVVESTVTLQNVTFPDTQGKILLKPRGNAVFAGHQRIALKVPIKGTQEMVSFSAVKLLNTHHLKQYAALLTQDKLRKISWKVTHLDPAASIPGFSEKETGAGITRSFQFYTAQGNKDYRGAIRSKKNRSVVLCHDISFFLGKNEDCFGVSQFDIQNYENNFCDLKVPEHWRLLQVQSGGITLFPEKTDAAHYRIELWPHVPVQRVEVFFAGTPSLLLKPDESRASDKTIPIPSFENLTVRKIHWSFFMEKRRGKEWKTYSLQLSGISEELLPQTIPLYSQGTALFRLQMNCFRLQHQLDIFNEFPIVPDTSNQDWKTLSALREKHWRQLFHETEKLIMPAGQNTSGKMLVTINRHEASSQKELPSRSVEDDQEDQDFSETLVRKKSSPEALLFEKIDSFSLTPLREQFEKIQTVSTTETVENGPVATEPDTLSLFFQKAPDSFLFAGGVSFLPLTELTLVTEVPQTPFFQRISVQYLFSAIVVFGLISIFSTKWFRELVLFVPGFWGMTFGVICLLFFKPSLIGWGIITLVFVASYLRRPVSGIEKT
ncbi:MAG: hypothetical protein LBQ54_15160 [Planctomycetaceae bacterium]|jgi:hypothetical protein|nr:hypothetical protein [Planctomycetaceae bacterium]